MKVLNIYSLNDVEEQNVIASLPEGKHLIGRGDLLNVTDKRVSRKHAVIEVSQNRVALTSLHVNPCFFKASNGKTLTVIAQGKESELNDGDQFALLPEDYWFKVKVDHGEEASKSDSTSDERVHVHSKRMHEEMGAEDADDNKRPRLLPVSEHTSHITEPHTSQPDFMLESIPSQHIMDVSYESKSDLVATTDNQENNEIQSQTTNVVIPKTANRTSQPVTPGTSHAVANTSETFEEDSLHFRATALIEDTVEDQNDIKQEVVDDRNNGQENDGADARSPAVKGEPQSAEQGTTPAVNADPSGASSSGTKKTRRERCWFGDRCFRKNPHHRDMFSHQGDQDYASDPEDDRPQCPYGAACYRKNLDHRREYKHLTRPAPKPRSPQAAALPKSPRPVSPPVNLPPRKRAGRPANQPDDDSEDDYDYNDPFIDDNSSDEYLPTDSDETSETEELDASQDLESQERRRMLKEAKKFIKKKK